MKDAGYQYVNIDDFWQRSRDASGTMCPMFRVFPSGMKALARLRAPSGLKFGLLTPTVHRDVRRHPGSRTTRSRMRTRMRAGAWDYVKEDNCNVTGDEETQYQMMLYALHKPRWTRHSSSASARGRLCPWNARDGPAIGSNDERPS